MLKRQNNKLNFAGAISCSLLLLFAFLAVNPRVGFSEPALAYKVPVVTEGGDSEEVGVTISFTPTSGSASITPTTGDGASAKINVSAKIQIASTGGYAIYLGGENSALTGEETGETIPGATIATTFANMATNTWGYAVAEGSSVPDTATYSALPQGQGTNLASESGNQTDVDKTYAISFAAKVGNDKPADIYSNQVTLSVTSSPRQLALDDISTMQEMTSDHCSGTVVGDSKQLKDTRDGKYYWVGKLADEKCWMTQNLDLDLSTGTALSSTTTDLNSKTTWTPGYSTATTASSSTILADDTGQRSWSLGNYRIADPTSSNNCGSGKGSAADCSGQFTSYSTPTSANNDANAHYILGNHYQWCAATAGCSNGSQTGASLTSGQASDSICPKGWKLPESNSTAVGSFGGLINAGSIGSDIAKLTSSPYYFVRGGNVRQNTSTLFDAAGNYGFYWSSTPRDNGATAYELAFGGGSYRNVSASDARQYGYSVRCIAR